MQPVAWNKWFSSEKENDDTESGASKETQNYDEEEYEDGYTP